jgi:hypothetical protein
VRASGAASTYWRGAPPCLRMTVVLRARSRFRESRGFAVTALEEDGSTLRPLAILMSNSIRLV